MSLEALVNIGIGLFAAIFFVLPIFIGNKKVFPLLSRLGSAVNLFSSFIGVVDCAIDIKFEIKTTNAIT
jgi:hypothetical protein